MPDANTTEDSIFLSSNLGLGAGGGACTILGAAVINRGSILD